MGEEFAERRKDTLVGRWSELDSEAALSEFREHLSAGATGTDGIFRVRGCDSERDKSTSSQVNSLRDSVPLRADGQTEGTVFHVGSRDDASIQAFDRRSHPEMRVWGI
jgi:hypothetical protein